ncbi:GGDEF domain-containing protein [Marilutibacter aestuarii]|uniref:diguanylate cyclase n=1 Tax=Marilutibacter aestuarii TaxID=1706195 RepID=A0A508ACN9_9GAMM|nr:GGDEF domain-containing protein [Lysobacter aestuarii]TQD43592.1 GGDEF domain-containing protein [Lysobacter aestuarii]
MTCKAINAARAMMLLGILALAMPARAGIEDALQRADALRTSDPQAFAAALSELDALEAQATEAQTLRIRLLRTYQKALTGNYEIAIKDAIALHQEGKDPTLKFRAALLAANTAAVTREFSLGLRYLEIALAMQDQVPDANDRHLGFLVAAILYTEYGQHSLSLQYAEQLLALETSPRIRCPARLKKIEAEWKLGSGAGNELATSQAIADCIAQQDAIATGFLRGQLARQWAAAGREGEAVELLESHLKEVEATGYPRLVGEIHSLLAEYRQATGDPSAAERHARAVLALGVKDAYSLPLVTAHRVLYETALERGDLGAALGAYRQYAEADKARLDEVKAREFAFQLSRHELQQRDHAIDLLSKQNEVLTLEQEVAKKSSQVDRLVILLLLMLAAMIGFWAYRTRRMQGQLRALAQTDGLTGLSNRRHFRERADVMLSRCTASGQEMALVLLDLDNFKHINDRHGHAAGDWLLGQVARACRAACREGDVCGRLGGEEFAIMSCGADLAAAQRIAQSCREQLARIDTAAIGHDRPITASFGCTTSLRSGPTFERMFAHADAAMYRAKADGRDTILTHVEPAPVTVLHRGQTSA